MGYLHDGHASLVRRARAECDVVVVSIFVNPLQFGANEDFSTYPRDLDRDVALLERERADVVFAPEAAELYPTGADTTVVPGAVALPLEGERRPGHFRGVATVVSMLFNIVQPARAYFGEKDWQQLQVVKQMVRDMHMPVEIVGVPTSRDPDGLAMSSRNVRLSADDRAHALVIPRAIAAARNAFAAGERSRSTIEAMMRTMLEREHGVDVDYAVLVDAATLNPSGQLTASTRVMLAARVGKVRLIDNAALGG
jgi:pantoate--beta-alanine ligase